MDIRVSNAAVTPGLTAVFCGEAGLPTHVLGTQLAKSAARAGFSALLVDCTGDAASRLNIQAERTLSDGLEGRADIRDVKYIAPGEGFTVAVAGKAKLGDLLGPIAALSLSYDCVIVIAPDGCTPDHVQLAGAADAGAMLFHSAGDRFMRAYWMLDAIRAAAPSCDPYMVGVGDKDDGLEAYELLYSTVRDFLGGPPPLGGIIDKDGDAGACADYIIEALTRHARREIYAQAMQLI